MFKNLSRALLGAAAASLLLTSSALAFEETTMYVLCNPESEVNIRSAPTTKGRYEGWLLLGDEVSVDDTRTDNQNRVWYHCPNLSNEAGEGWVCGAYLTDEAVEVESFVGTVCANGRVAARQTPSGKRKAWLHNGDEVTVFAQTCEWSVTDKGYIKTEFIERSTEK